MAPAPSPANAGSLVGRRLGKFEILALLALGGTAEIYLARIGGEAGFEKYVVVKCLHDHLADDAEFVRMFLDEARLGAQLDHSNIVQTLELGEENGRYYMVMEYLAGMSLALIARRARKRLPDRRIPVDIVLGLTAQACGGLHYAHQRNTTGGSALNIVHRDVSPQNLVVSFEGVLKIVDFGIAKADVRETKTKSGTIKGKFAYMSPEQCLAKDVDRRTDIFALGTLLHELLTGRRLFKRSTTYDTYQAIVQGNIPTPSSVNDQLDPRLDETVMKAIAYNRDERYPTAEAFGQALLSVLHSRGKSINASDIARFFDEHFKPEIEEHQSRMRELISGRRATTMDDLAWDVSDGQSDVAAQMPDDRPEALSKTPAPIETVANSVPKSVDTGWTAPTAVDSGKGKEELEDESTRIELNPLERVQELHAHQENKARLERAVTTPAREAGKIDEQTVDLSTRTRSQTDDDASTDVQSPPGEEEEEEDSTSVQQPTPLRKLGAQAARPGAAAPASKSKQTLRGLHKRGGPPGDKQMQAPRVPNVPTVQPRTPSAQRPAVTPPRPPPGSGPAPSSGPQAKTLFGAAAPKLPPAASGPPPAAPPAGGSGTRPSSTPAPERRFTPLPLTPPPEEPDEQRPPHTPAPQLATPPPHTPAPQFASPPPQTPAPQLATPPPQTPAPQLATPPPQTPAPQFATPPPQTPAPQFATPPPSGPAQMAPAPGAPPAAGHPAGSPPSGPQHTPVPGRSGQAAPGEVFPQLNTPSAVMQRADLVAMAGSAAQDGDLALLADEKAGGPYSPLFLVIAFILSVAVGFGITYLITMLRGG